MRLRLLKNNNQGFTLIEAMICILLVSIGLLAISKMQVSSIKGNKLAMDTMRASLLSSAAEDQIMCSLYTGGTLNPADVTGATFYDWASPDSNYTIKYSVQNVALTLKIVTLTTSWVEGAQSHTLNKTITVLNSISTHADNS